MRRAHSSQILLIACLVVHAGCFEDTAKEPAAGTAGTTDDSDGGLVDAAAAGDPDVAGQQDAPTLSDLAAGETTASCPGGDFCPCTENAGCQSGQCIDDPNSNMGKACAQPCKENCPAGYLCTLIKDGGGDGANFCVPKFNYLCDPCATSAGCQAVGLGGSVCVDYGGGGRYCGTACVGTADCPDGYTCEDAPTTEGKTAKACVRKPDADQPGTWGACPCSKHAIALGLKTACFKVAPGGDKCMGERACGASGLQACSAGGPSKEFCNGKDDDCNGKTDELSCDDGKPCTADACDPVGLVCGNTPTDGPCDDGKLCTENDACVAGECKAGKGKDCEDGNPCTTDACDAAKGQCTHVADDGAPCDDKNACTMGDVCKDQACLKGKVVECKGDACTNVKCEPTTGACASQAKQPNEACDDDPCMSGKSCNAQGFCSGGAKIDCNDKNPCTADACEPGKGCAYSPTSAPCDDGNACTQKDGCSVGACTGVPDSKLCDDANPCTNDNCAAAIGCTYAPSAGACDDGDACTKGDACAAGKCVAGTTECVCASDADCLKFEDGNACNGTLVCAKQGSGGKCEVNINTVKVCDAAAGTVCAPIACDPKSGTCVAGLAADGTACDDGSSCTTADKCSLGKCLGLSTKDCGDGNTCTDDNCIAGDCVFTPSVQACSDGNSCTGADSCVKGACVGGPSPKCDDGNPCTSEKCDPATGCQSTPSVGACDDGDGCTTADVCAAAACKGGAAKNCSDGNACTDDNCVTGTCQNLANTVLCEDGNSCTESDTCAAKSCKAGSAKVCNDGNPCTVDKCDPAKGCTVSSVLDGTVCTTGSCKAGKCGGSCSGKCGGAGTSACYCDYLCAGFGDCCGDFVGQCGGGKCDDGTCQAKIGETCSNCKGDCGCLASQTCTSGKCVGTSTCGNGAVDAGETCSNCAADIKCGAGTVCTSGQCCKTDYCQTNNLSTGKACNGNTEVSCGTSGACNVVASSQNCPNGCSGGACIGCGGNFCQTNGYGSGQYCDGGSLVSCGTSGACKTVTSTTPCPNGCSGGACVNCSSNFCQTYGYGSGQHCDGSSVVACGASGPCKTVTGKTPCPNGCSGGACVNCSGNFCQNNGYGSGQYCDNGAVVTCGTSGACKTVTGTTPCSSGCSGGTCVTCSGNFCQNNGYGNGQYCNGNSVVTCSTSGSCKLASSTSCPNGCSGGSCISCSTVCSGKCGAYNGCSCASCSTGYACQNNACVKSCSATSYWSADKDWGMSSVPALSPALTLTGHLFSNGQTVYVQVCKDSGNFVNDVHLKFNAAGKGLSVSKVVKTVLSSGQWCTPGQSVAASSITAGDTLAGSVRLVSPATCEGSWNSTCSNGVTNCGYCFYSSSSTVGTLTATCKWP